MPPTLKNLNPLKLRTTEVQTPAGMKILNQWAESINQALSDITASAKQTNQQVATVTSTVATGSGSGGGLSNVILDMPPAFTVTSAIASGVETINAAWAPEPQGYFLAAAPPGLSALIGTSSNTAAGTGPPTYPPVTPTITGTCSMAPAWGLYTSWSAGTGFSVPPGWTGFGNCAVLSIASAGSITVTEPGAATQTYGNSLMFFAGTLPAQVQQATNTYSSSGGVTTTCVVPYPVGNTAGNALMVVLKGVPGYPHSGGALSFTDSAGNSYYQIATGTYSQTNFNQGGFYYVYMCPSCVGGSNTVTGTGSVYTGGGGLCKVDIYEFGTLQTGLTYPIFRPISPSDLPPLNANNIAAGLLLPAFGGTGTNLSVTGGSNKVLFQNSVGAAITVGTMDYNQLAGQNVATTYNNVTLTNLGIPSEVLSLTLTNQTANITATNLGALSASGRCRVSVYIRVTQVATTSSTLPDVELKWNDYTTGNVVTSAPLVAASPSGNTQQVYAEHTFFIKASSAQIQYQVGQSTAYASVGGTPMQFALDIVVEQM